MAGEGGMGGLCEVGVDTATYPYMPSMRGKKVMRFCAQGHCDETMGDLTERLAPMRHAIVAFRGTIAGANQNIVFAGGVERTVFEVGVTGSGDVSGLGGTMTRAETNGEAKGGLAPKGMGFVMVGAYVQPMQPWTVATGQPLIGSVDATSPRNYRAFLRNPQSPYDKAILAAVADATSFEGKNGSTSCGFDFAPLGMLLRDKDGMPGMFWYFSTQGWTGGSDDTRSFKGTIKQQRQVVIENDGANATPGAMDVAAAYHIAIMGYPVCQVSQVPQGYVSVDEAKQMAYDAAQQAVRDMQGGGPEYVDLQKQGGRPYRAR